MNLTPHNLLLLFDIDGTLIRINRQKNHHILAEALSKCGIDSEPIFEQKFAGRTDRDIFLSVPGANPDDFDCIRHHYEKLIESELKSEHIEVIPGVSSALHYFHQQGYSLGLITGNCRNAAFTKLRKAGLDHFFQTGGFGDDHQDRNYLPALAREAASEYFGKTYAPEATFIIGDTPNDIRCARHGSCHAIAVATGSYSGQELEQHNPCLLLSSLENPQNHFNGYIRTVS